MSRSNGPVTRGESHHQDWPYPADSNLPGQTPNHQPAHWPPIFPQHPSGRHPHPAPQPEHAQPDHQAAGYHYPQHQSARGYYPQQDQYGQNGYSSESGAAHQAFSAPGRHPPFFGDQSSQYGSGHHQPSPYASSFEDHLRAPGGQQPAYRDDQELSRLQTPGQSRRGHTTLRDQLQSVQGHGWQQPYSQPGPAPRNSDPRDYDLGSYMPSAEKESPGYGQGELPSHHNHFESHWQDQHDYRYGYDHEGRPSGGAADYYAQVGNEALPVEHNQEFGDPDSEEFDDYEYEEPRRSRRGLLITGALVGAIIAGGGLAYGYKIIIGPTASGTPPVIKADSRPAKSQPEDPGGRQFAHSDSKLMGRLGADSLSGSSTSGSARASTLDSSSETGVRRVPTIVVGRDGSIAPPAEPRLPPPTVSVPGMTIVNGFGMPSPGQPPEREERVQAAQVPPAPQVPQIIAKADPQPSPTAAAAPSRQPSNVPPLPVRSAAVAPAAPTASREAAPLPKATQPAPRQTAAAPAAPKSQPIGYVAVLASQKSRIDALKTFADLQQKYFHVLRNKIPDVQEADLSARGLGTMYRVVVGPPGSREAAADLCGQLKSAGFEGCWITTY